ncbi:MAG: hypothetical protein WCP20_13240 [Desulfuromonadales bacterium]
MQKFVTVLCSLLVTVAGSGCGNKSTSAADAIYDTPPTLAPANSHMGGAVQGTALVLSKSVATLAGSVGITALADGSGNASKFYHPTDITTDGTNFYITDYLNNVIRKMDASGVVTTLACTDADSGAAIGFYRPTGITTDGKNLYVVDSGTNTIRFIDIASRKVTTIGSTSGSAGSVDTTLFPPASTADKTYARFNNPTGITTDGVNLYVADSGNQTIRRIVIATRAVSTLSGISGSAGTVDGTRTEARFNLPARITTDGSSLFVTDFGNRTVRRIAIATGAVSTIAGKAGPLGSDSGTIDSTDGTGATAQFYQPNGITTDGTSLYVTDSYKNTIRRIVISSGAVTTIAGTAGTAGHNDAIGAAATFDTPIGITTDGAALYIVDSGNNTIRKMQ